MHKISELEFPESRYWYNDWIEKQSKDLKVLDVGKSIHWDYSGHFKNYKTIDNASQHSPDIVGNIEDYVFNEKFDLVLLNGMYEFVDIEKTLKNIKKITDKCLCGFVTNEYKAYKKEWQSFNGDMTIFKDWNVEEVIDFKDYIYILLTNKKSL